VEERLVVQETKEEHLNLLALIQLFLQLHQLEEVLVVEEMKILDVVHKMQKVVMVDLEVVEVV
jgi:hypothetical protein